jgi:hypothetical protein
LSSRGRRQRGQLFDGFLGGDEVGIDPRRRPLRAAAREVETHQQRDFSGSSQMKL